VEAGAVAVTRVPADRAGAGFTAGFRADARTVSDLGCVVDVARPDAATAQLADGAKVYEAGAFADAGRFAHRATVVPTGMVVDAASLSDSTEVELASTIALACEGNTGIIAQGAWGCITSPANLRGAGVRISAIRGMIRTLSAPNLMGASRRPYARLPLPAVVRAAL
jgi:hypothetical protein